MPVGVMTDLRSILLRLMRAVARRCSPSELKRQKNHHADDQPSTHAAIVLIRDEGLE